MMRTGDLCEIPEVKYEWVIKDFLQLSDEGNSRFISPEFHCFGESWEIWIDLKSLFYKNRHGTNNSSIIYFYILRKSIGAPVTVDSLFSLKTGYGETELSSTFRHEFKIHDEKGHSGFIDRSELIEKKSNLLPSGVLTLICSLKKSGSNNADGNGSSKKIEKICCVDSCTQTNEESGVWKLQQNLQDILENGNVSDVVLKVDDQEFKSHRCILAARSPVFLAMMTHETKEKNSGVVDIPDMDPNVFSYFLHYLYTGRSENVTMENVVRLYTAADKYQVDELKTLCSDYMLKNITVDNFCDFLSLSLQFVEKDLTDACSQFFIRNALAISLTSSWQTFITQNPIAGNELHIKAYKGNK